MNDIHAHRSAHKDGEWLTMSAVAVKLGINHGMPTDGGSMDFVLPAGGPGRTWSRKFSTFLQTEAGLNLRQGLERTRIEYGSPAICVTTRLWP